MIESYSECNEVERSRINQTLVNLTLAISDCFSLTIIWCPI